MLKQLLTILLLSSSIACTHQGFDLKKIPITEHEAKAIKEIAGLVKKRKTKKSHNKKNSPDNMTGILPPNPQMTGPSNTGFGANPKMDGCSGEFCVPQMVGPSAKPKMDSAFGGFAPTHTSAPHNKQQVKITPEKIRRFYPPIAPRTLNTLNRPALFVEHGITTRQRLAHFLAQITLEAEGLRNLTDTDLKAKLAFWKDNNLNSFADSNDFCSMRRKIKGAAKGINETQQLYKRALAALGNDMVVMESANEPRNKADETEIYNLLAERGIKPSRDGKTSERLKNTLIKYQRSRYLSPTGKLDVDTLMAMTNPLEANIRTDSCAIKF